MNSAPGSGDGGAPSADGRHMTLTEQIAAELRGQIMCGRLAPAAVLPSERRMAETHGVDRVTIRRAIGMLQAEGLVQAIHGKGVFVRRAGDWPTNTHHRTITVDGDGNYVDSESTLGEWRQVESEKTSEIDAGTQLALAFGVPAGSAFYMSDRILENDAGTRIAVRVYLPATVMNELRGLRDMPYISARRVYQAARAAGMALDFNDYVSARNPTPDDAHALLIPPGIPMLTTRRIATHDGRPIVMQETHRSAEDTQLHYRPAT